MVIWVEPIFKILFKVSKWSVVSILLLFEGIFISEAFAYIDPGSGSMVIQMVIAALVGAGIAIKVFWEKLKYKFSSILKKE
jgi:hypothetical protein|tara:strand:+ start:649 stop:891 length:243 start_codon:yes stop_codon:yes gene_type:complete